MKEKLIRGSIQLIIIQSGGSLVCFVASMYLLGEIGLSEFGKISTIYSVFALIGSLIAFGLPEYFQAWTAKKNNDRELLNIPIIGYLLLIILQFYLLYTPANIYLIKEWGFSIELFYAFPFAFIGYILTEMACREGFQSGKNIIPQFILSLQAVMVWLWLVIEYTLTGKINILIPLLIIYFVFGLISIIYIRKKIKFLKIKITVFPINNIGQKSFLTRVLILFYDTLPLLIAQFIGFAYIAGVYAYFARLFGPIGMISTSFIIQLQRRSFEKLNSFEKSINPFLINLFFMVIFSALIAVVSENLLINMNPNHLNENKYQELIFFMLSLYRGMYISFQFAVQVNLNDLKFPSIGLIYAKVIIAIISLCTFKSCINIEILPVFLILLMSGSLIIIYLDMKK
jgi:hypothetical protein